MVNFGHRLCNQFSAFHTYIVDSFDHFGQQPEFRILQKKKFSTNVGFMATCCIITICLIQMYDQMIDVLNKTNPNVVITEYQMINTQEFSVVPENFTLAFTLMDQTLSVISGLGKYFNISVINCERQRVFNESTGQTTVTNKCLPYPIEQCQNEKHFITKTQKEFFQSFNTTHLYCLNSGIWNSRAIKLQGAPQSSEFQYIQMTITQCVNSSSYTACASTESINKILQRGYFVVHSANVLVKMENANSPYDSIIESQYYSFSLTNSKLILSQLQVLSTSTDIGLIQNQYQNRTSLQQGQIQQSNDIYNNAYLMQYSILLDQKTTLYKRSYIKLQTIMGSIGGLWQVMTLIFSFILTPLISYFAKVSLANQHFQFQKLERHSRNLITQNDIVSSPQHFEMDKVEEEIPEPLSTNRKKIKQHFPEESLNLEQSIHIQRFLKLSSSKAILHIRNLKDIIWIFFGCGKPKKLQKMQLDFAIEKIMQKLDISFILSKLYEIDKLKNILLTQDQLSLFNYIPMPVIPFQMFDFEFAQKIQLLQSKDAYKFLLDEEKTDEIKIQEAYTSYQKLKQKRKLTVIENSILRFLDDNIKIIFDKFSKGNQQIANLPNNNDRLHVWNDSQSLSKIPCYESIQQIQRANT